MQKAQKKARTAPLCKGVKLDGDPCAQRTRDKSGYCAWHRSQATGGMSRSDGPPSGSGSSKSKKSGPLGGSIKGGRIIGGRSSGGDKRVPTRPPYTEEEIERLRETVIPADFKAAGHDLALDEAMSLGIIQKISGSMLTPREVNAKVVLPSPPDLTLGDIVCFWDFVRYGIDVLEVRISSGLLGRFPAILPKPQITFANRADMPVSDGYSFGFKGQRHFIRSAGGRGTTAIIRQVRQLESGGRVQENLNDECFVGLHLSELVKGLNLLYRESPQRIVEIVLAILDSIAGYIFSESSMIRTRSCLDLLVVLYLAKYHIHRRFPSACVVFNEAEEGERYKAYLSRQFSEIRLSGSKESLSLAACFSGKPPGKKWLASRMFSLLGLDELLPASNNRSSEDVEIEKAEHKRFSCIRQLAAKIDAGSEHLLPDVTSESDGKSEKKSSPCCSWWEARFIFPNLVSAMIQSGINPRKLSDISLDLLQANYLLMDKGFEVEKREEKT